MQISILQDDKAIGKTSVGTKHPIKGKFKTLEFGTADELSDIIKNLQTNECLTVGLFPDGYHYVPSSNAQALTKPKYITRTSANAAPGHIFLIDCDFDTFYGLKGIPLHEFLAQFLPDIFEGASYVTTHSTSFYTKSKKAFHQYYLFEHPTDFTQLSILVNKLFEHHNLLTYSLASNYSRVYTKTPIDTKLRELQMPIFEASQPRLNSLQIDKAFTTEIGQGVPINAKTLALPGVDVSQALSNQAKMKQQGEAELTLKRLEFAKTHNIPDRVDELEHQLIPLSMTLVKSNSSSKTLETTLKDEVMTYLKSGTPPHDLYKAVGEPDYASHQTAKLFYDKPLRLSSYVMVDQAHGGIKYSVVADFEEMSELLSIASEKSSISEFFDLCDVTHTLSANEISQVASEFAKTGQRTKSEIVKKLIASSIDNVKIVVERDEQSFSLSDEDVHTMEAAIQKAKVVLTKQEQLMLLKGVQLEKMFNAGHIQTVKDSTYLMDRDIILKPGDKHDYNRLTKSQAVKFLAPKYPPTNISPNADEAVLAALIEKYTATNRVEEISYKSTLHGEKLFFGDGRVEITTQQARPSFENVSQPIKRTLDYMTEGQYSEFRDIYMQESLGDIWSTIAELSYIKKVYPQLKKDYLWLNFPSDAGKTFNMDIANIISTYEKTNLDQFFEQASKLKPQSIASASFLFHDEVKAFHHQWNELGAFYAIKGMYSVSSNITQLPLKVLASAEKTLTKGTKQQLNRLMTINSTAKPFFELGISERDELAFSAVAHRVIYEAFTDSYNKYAGMPEHQAVNEAIARSKVFALKHSPRDMVVAEDYIKDMVKSFLFQEYYDIDSDSLVFSEALEPFVKKVAMTKKPHTLYVCFRHIDAPKFIQFILDKTTSRIEGRSMNYEALSIDWTTLGCADIRPTPRTIGGVSGFYGQTLTIDFKDLDFEKV